MKFSTRMLSGAAALAICAAGTAAYAQNQVAQAQSGLEEIVVTAQRRSENLQTVPIALTAITAQELERRQITRTLDLIQHIPNLNGNNNTGLGSANVYYLRGVGSTESLAVFDPPVGTYVDEFYNARQAMNNFAFFDVERIEVLRGPQGTLYGRNTTGGSINLYMKKPGEELGGFVELGFGKYDQTMGRASIDVPIMEGKLLSKWTGFWINDDGYVTNLTTGEQLNDYDNWGLRGAIQARFSDTAQWDFSVAQMHDGLSNVLNHPGPNGGRVAYTPQTTTRGLGATLISAGLVDIPLGNDADMTQAISNFAIELNDTTNINIITGYQELDHKFMTDGGEGLNSAAPNVVNGVLVNVVRGNSTPLVNHATYEQFTQELKINGSLGDGKVDYVTGFYYFHEKANTNFATLTLPPPGSTAARLAQVDRVLKNRTSAYAGYAQADWNMTDQFKATAGIRYTSESKAIEFTPNPTPLPRLVPAFSTIDMVNNGIPTSQSVKIWTPRFVLNYQANDDLLAYVSATRGFKSGGWNGRSVQPQQTLPFGPEKAWTYEIGVKSDWWDDKLRANINGFLNEVSDFQGASAVVDRVTNLPVFLTQNFATLEVYGLESDITVAPVENLTLQWTMGTQSSKYKNLAASIVAQQANCRNNRLQCGAAIVTTTGEIAEPVRAPKFTSSLNVNYSIPVGSDMQFDLNGTWSYSTTAWVASANLPGTLQPKRSIYSAGIALRNPDAGWSIMADCTNCSNKRYVASFITFQYPNEPSRWLIHAKYDF
ncbi:MAG: TonB-dependent receptor [Rhodospirillaceae bacterium]|nr:TonB-dependent receptor [Rhodospirillaceae bacterium]